MKVYIVTLEDESGAAIGMWVYKDIQKAILKERDLMEKDSCAFVYNSIHEVIE